MNLAYIGSHLHFIFNWWLVLLPPLLFFLAWELAWRLAHARHQPEPQRRGTAILLLCSRLCCLAGSLFLAKESEYFAGFSSWICQPAGVGGAGRVGVGAQICFLALKTLEWVPPLFAIQPDANAVTERKPYLRVMDRALVFAVAALNGLHGAVEETQLLILLDSLTSSSELLTDIIGVATGRNWVIAARAGQNAVLAAQWTAVLYYDCVPARSLAYVNFTYAAILFLFWFNKYVGENFRVRPTDHLNKKAKKK